MKNSLKQLIRTPVKAFLFLLLMATATALLILGANLWQNTQNKIDETEDVFVTLGTVEQLPDYERQAEDLTLDNLWRGTDSTEPVYEEIYSPEILDFEGASYIHKPEKRTYYLALLPETYSAPERSRTPPFQTSCIVEFTPQQDGYANQRMTVHVNWVLYGTYNYEEMEICDILSSKPQWLESGKNYLAYVNLSAESLNAWRDGDVFFVPQLLTHTAQYDSDGNIIRGAADALDATSRILEVTDDFYQSDMWRYWENWVDALYTRWEAYPVLATNSINLLPTFHEGTVMLSAGRKITDEEFENGDPVCMVSAEFANNCGLSIGDRIPLSLYLANQADSAQKEFGFRGQWEDSSYGMLNADGEPYSVFFEQDYEIVGLYNTFRLTGTENGTSEVARNMFIIPANSVKASDEHNIGAYGPMNRWTTSFQIENGTIDQYMEAYTQSVPEEIRNRLDLTFDDGGYSQVIGGLNNMRAVSILLFVVGLLAALMIIILLLYFFIVRQKKRTAIERSLGMSRRQCCMSLVSGVVVLSVVAVVIGTIGSTFLMDKVEALDLTGQAEQIYSTEYSLWAREEAELPEEETEEASGLSILNLVIPVGLVLLTAALSVLMVNLNLKTEPIELLSVKVK